MIELPERRRIGHVDRARGGAQSNSLKRLCARDVGIENTDHFQPDVIDFQHLTESGIVAEEILADGGANDRYLRVRLLVERIEGAPFRELHAAELEVMVGDAERHRVRPRRRAHHLVRFQADSRGYPFDSRDRLPNRIDVAAGEPRRFLSNLHQVFASEVLGIHDDVAQPETLDHLERLSLCAFTDREHRDHRTDAEDHSEHAETRAQLVCRQAVDGVAERLGEAHGKAPFASDVGAAAGTRRD